MNLPEPAARRLRGYRPDALSDQEWRLAREAVIDLVAQVQPTTPVQVKILCTAVCSFLAGPCGWDRTSAPDLTALLHQAAIDAFIASRRSAGAQGRARMALERLQRAANGIPTGPRPEPGRRHTRPSREVAAVYADAAGLSVAGFAGLYRARTAKELTESRLTGLVHTLLATAPPVVPGTVPVHDGALVTYLGTVDVEPDPEVVEARTSTPRRRAEKFSHRRAQAALRADRAAYRRVTTGPKTTSPPDTGALAPEVREAIEKYRPVALSETQWAALRDLVLRLVVGYRPPSPVSTRNVATIVVSFLTWVWDLPDRPDPAAPPTPEELLSAPLEEAFIRRRVDDPGAPTGSVGTERSVLRRCLRSLDADAVDVVLNHTPVAPPYTPDQCEQFAMVALAQNTVARERNACYLIGLSLGAGLAPEDYRAVRCADITEQHTTDGTTYLTVTVTRAGASRTVPIRSAYEPLVRRALELSTDLPSDALVLGGKATKRNVTESARREILTARGPLDLEVNRLRTTWLFALMNAQVPLRELLQMAGLRSPRTLTNLLPLCPAPNTDVLDAATHAARTAPDSPQATPTRATGAGR